MAITQTALQTQVGAVLKVDGGPASFELLSVDLSSLVVTTSYLPGMKDFLEEKLTSIATVIPLPDRLTFYEGLVRSLIRVGSLDMAALDYTVALVGNVVSVTVSGYADPSYVIVSQPHSVNFAAELDAGWASQGSGGSVAGTVVASDLTLAIDPGGADGADPARPPPLTGGDFSAVPYLTVNGALSEVPRILDADVNIILNTGMVDELTLKGFVGSGTLHLNGTPSETLTLATGSSSGVCGAGTTTTSVVKPTGAVDWTASDLVGRMVFFPAGVGGGTTMDPVGRVIKANTTTSFTIDAVTGLDDTANFTISDIETQLRSVNDNATQSQILRNDCPIVVRAVKFVRNFGGQTYLYGIQSIGNKDILFDSCQLDIDFVVSAIDSLRDRRVRMTNCIITNSDGAANVTIAHAMEVEVTNCYNKSGGQIAISNSFVADVTKLVASTAPSTVLRLTNIHAATAEVNANNGGATPVYAESVGYFEAVGTKLIGSGNTGWGLQMEKMGLYSLTGSTITGASGDVKFMGNTANATWANLSGASFGMLEEHAGSAFANSAYTKAIKYGNYAYLGNVDLDGRLLLRGYLNQAFTESARTATGSSASDALNMASIAARGGVELTTVAAGTGVKLPDGAALAGVQVTVINNGGNTLTVYPPSGGVLMPGSVASITIAAGASRIFCSLTGGLNFQIVT